MCDHAIELVHVHMYRILICIHTHSFPPASQLNVYMHLHMRRARMVN